MVAIVHGGNLGRWFEELCRINFQQLKQVVSASGEKLSSSRLPHTGGVYTFWWTGDIAILKSNRCYRQLTLPGPGKQSIDLRIDDEWLGLETDLPIPLYVGKSAYSIAKRVGQHLRLKEKRMLPLGGNAVKQPRPTTSCQLRAGVEHFFPQEADTRTLILENIGISYVELNGNDHAANRFYLEDLAIGLMRPPFNIDVER